jgi:hypothetical protein
VGKVTRGQQLYARNAVLSWIVVLCREVPGVLPGRCFITPLVIALHHRFISSSESAESAIASFPFPSRYTSKRWPRFVSPAPFRSINSTFPSPFACGLS